MITAATIKRKALLELYEKQFGGKCRDPGYAYGRLIRAFPETDIIEAVNDLAAAIKLETEYLTKPPKVEKYELPKAMRIFDRAKKIKKKAKIKKFFSGEIKNHQKILDQLTAKQRYGLELMETVTTDAVRHRIAASHNLIGITNDSSLVSNSAAGAVKVPSATFLQGTE